MRVFSLRYAVACFLYVFNKGRLSRAGRGDSPLLFTLLLATPLLSFSQLPHPVPVPESYVCYQAPTAIAVDGRLDDAAWQEAAWTSDFVDIEGDRKPAPYARTRVKMLWDSTYWYFAAELQETHLWATLRQRDTVIFYDKDFEIFIDPDGDTHGYYELELNAFNTVWDLLLPKPYRAGGPAIDHWDINGLKSTVHLYGTVNDASDTDTAWTVEVAIPWDVLEEYAPHNGPPQDGEQWRLNFSRVHYDIMILDGNYRKARDTTGQLKPEYNWVWSPQYAINMHRPETWGYVQFSERAVGEEPALFRPDPDFQLKMAMFRVYLAQDAYRKAHGRYTPDIAELGLPPEVIDELGNRWQLEVLPRRYVLVVEGEDGNWEIDEEGRLIY